MKAGWIVVPCLGVSFVAVPAQLRPAPERFIVPSEQVSRAIVTDLAGRGIEVSADQVKVVAAIVANEPSPLLEVSGIQKLGRLNPSHPDQESLGVRLRCKAAGSCLPFYAMVTLRVVQDMSAAAVKESASLPGISAPPKVVKVGARLTMLMEAEHARIQLEVISLSSAALGQQLRVTTPDHKHSYVAEVLTPTLVKGSF